MKNLRKSIHTFVGTGKKPEAAVLAGKQQANKWLETHQWQRPDGGLAYDVGTTMYALNGIFIYIVQLIGPDDPAPAFED